MSLLISQASSDFFNLNLWYLTLSCEFGIFISDLNQAFIFFFIYCYCLFFFQLCRLFLVNAKKIHIFCLQTLRNQNHILAFIHAQSFSARFSLITVTLYSPRSSAVANLGFLTCCTNENIQQDPGVHFDLTNEWALSSCAFCLVKRLLRGYMNWAWNNAKYIGYAIHVASYTHKSKHK